MDSEELENEMLYNQAIDDQGNVIRENQEPVELSQYELDYNETISLIGKICKQLIWNNTPANKDRKIQISESSISEIAERVKTLIASYDI